LYKGRGKKIAMIAQAGKQGKKKGEKQTQKKK